VNESPDRAGAVERIERRGARNRLFVLFLVVGTLALLAVVAGASSRDEVEHAAETREALATAVFVPLGALLVVALVPAAVVAAAAGVLFGVAIGTPLALLTITLGALGSAALGRFVARDAVDTLAGPRLARAIALVERRSFFSLLYARIVPGVPQALISYAAGLTRVPLGVFVAATALAMAPRAYAYTALGGTFGDLGRPETVVALAVLAMLAVCGAVALAVQRRRIARG
jgi:uncharacterized membrane protein YdjX (TVP38/TMEM64 family)